MRGNDEADPLPLARSTHVLCILLVSQTCDDDGAAVTIHAYQDFDGHRFEVSCNPTITLSASGKTWVDIEKTHAATIILSNTTVVTLSNLHIL